MIYGSCFRIVTNNVLLFQYTIEYYAISNQNQKCCILYYELVNLLNLIDEHSQKIYLYGEGDGEFYISGFFFTRLDMQIVCNTIN